MNELYMKMRSSLQGYNNCADMLKTIYGLDKERHYDALIIAPSWKPEKIFAHYCAEICVLKRGTYYCGYEVTIGNQVFGYVQTASCSGNVIDCCLTLGESVCDKVIFIGAAGSLKSNIALGDIVIPEYSIAGDGGSLYLYDKILINNFSRHVYPNIELSNCIFDIANDLKMEIKQKVVYCTDTIFCEYMHLDEILSLGSDLVEMETAAFFRCMDLIEKKGIALLCVSDNSATNSSLIARTIEDTDAFHRARDTYIPQLIVELAHRIK